MKAATRNKYGGPEVISIRDIDIPTPKDNEVLIRVHATTVNRTDCGILWADPFIVRLFTGLTRPKSLVTGTDFAGQIEAVGSQVSSFQVGDRVFGFDDGGQGTHAEYVALAQDKALLTMPDDISYEVAAASSEGAHYALNFINKVRLELGQQVLVNGATGAIGSAVVQFLKYLEVSVTATCAAQHIDLVKSLGADRVIDYTKEDFTTDSEQYDYVLDAVGTSTFGKCKPLLKDNGVYISSELGPKAQNPFLALVTPLRGGKRVIFPFPSNIKASLQFIKKRIENKQFRPVIDRTYPLDEIAEAYRYVASGQKTGNVVISIIRS
jgi:NADPH:quinone reductase-like Zn-dependent oxidoreductase